MCTADIGMKDVKKLMCSQRLNVEKKLPYQCERKPQIRSSFHLKASINLVWGFWHESGLLPVRMLTVQLSPAEMDSLKFRMKWGKYGFR